MIPKRIWLSVVVSLLWVFGGFGLLSLVELWGFWATLPLIVIFATSIAAIGRERRAVRAIATRRLWLGWLIGVVWLTSLMVGRILSVEDSAPGVLRMFLILSGLGEEGSLLIFRDIYLAISFTLLVWSGIELGRVTYQSRSKTHTTPPST